MEIPAELSRDDDSKTYKGRVDDRFFAVGLSSTSADGSDDGASLRSAFANADADEWGDSLASWNSSDLYYIGNETYENDTATVLAAYFCDYDDADCDSGYFLVQGSNGEVWFLLLMADDGGDFETTLAAFRSIGRSIELADGSSGGDIDAVAGAVRALKSGGSSGTTSTKSTGSSVSSSSGWLSDYFRSFSPVTETGRGDDVIDVPCAGTPCIMKITHSGSSNFAVWGLDSSGDNVELYVNEIGNYSGTVTSLFEYDELEALEINADGSWSIEFAPLSDAPQATSGSTFEGDGVVWIDESSMRKIRFTHDGDSNFAVWAIGVESSRDLLVNDIGSYSGTVSWNDPQAIFVVTADGKWSLSW